MAEFFSYPLIGHFLRAIDAFPVARHRADRKTIRVAIERLKAGCIAGVFPEGGIRDGGNSLLEGAPLRRGPSTLAHLARVPILPCVIVGSDRFYAPKNWLPLRRTPIWVAFGDPISFYPELEKSEARERIERELATAFNNLYVELRETFSLTPDDLPHPPRERMKGCGALGRRDDLGARLPGSRTGCPTIHQEPSKDCRASASLPVTAIGNRSHWSTIGRHSLSRLTATGIDSLMCASMNLLQSRHRLHACSRDEMEDYLAECEKLTPQDYYAAPDNIDFAMGRISQIRRGIDSSKWRTGGLPAGPRIGQIEALTWRSPITTKFPSNNVARVDCFPCARGWSAPTVLMLHALMSNPCRLSPMGSAL